MSSKPGDGPGPDDPVVPLVCPSLKLDDLSPALHPLAYSDLLERATEELGAGRREVSTIADVRIIKDGWEARAMIRYRAVGQEEGQGSALQAGVEIRQEWGGKVNLTGRVEWVKKW